MTNFIDDGTALEAVKSNFQTQPAIPSYQKISATDWNGHRQALLDIQSFLRGAFAVFDVGAAHPVSIESYNGNPNGVLTRAQGSLAVDYTNAKLYQNQDGATSWAKFGGGSASLSIATATSPGTLNVSSEGTLDWLVPGASRLPNNAYNVPHAKIGGAGLLHSYEWVVGTQGGAVSLTTFNGQTPTLTNNAGDDIGLGGLSGTAIHSFAQVTSTTATGFGFLFRVPAVLANRVLRVYTDQYSCDIKLTATLTDADGTTTSQNATRTAAASASNASKWTLNFKSGVGLGYLDVVVLVSANNHDGGNALNIGCGAITLSTV
jgi:hypothetical protein